MNTGRLQQLTKFLYEHKKLSIFSFFVFFFVVAGLMSFSHAHEAEAYQCVSTSNAVNWSSPQSWTSCNNSYPGSPGNGNTDTVTISDNTLSIIADHDVTVGWMTFTGGSKAASVSINSGVTVTISGILTINAPTASVTKELAVGNGSLVANGISIVGGTSANFIARVSATTGSITTTGGITFSGTVAQSQFVTTGAATVNLTGTISTGGTLNLNSLTNLVSSGTSAVNLASTWAGLTVSSGALTFGSGSISFTGAVSIVSGANIITGAGTVAFGQNVNIPTGSTMTLGSGNATFSSTVSIDGTLTTSTATGTVTFGDAVTVNGGGVLSFSGFAKVTSWAGDIVMSGVTFNSGTGAVTLPAGTFTISGSSDITFGWVTTLSGAATFTGAGNLTFNSTLTVSGSVVNNKTGTVQVTSTLSGAGSWVQGTNSYLKIGSNPTITTIDASSNVNTVEYYGNGLTLKPIIYSTLKISGGSSYTVTGVTTVNADFITTGSASLGTFGLSSLGGNLNFGGGSVSMGANLTMSGNLNVSGGTLSTGAFDFTVNGTTNVSGGTLNLSNNTGVKTLSGQVSLTGGTISGASTNIVMNTGIDNNGGVVSITGTVTISVAGFAFSGTGTGITTLTVNSPGSITNSTSISIGTLNGTGSWTQGINSQLFMTNAGTILTITNFDATATGNTVTYSNTGVSTTVCRDTQYYNLTLLNGGNCDTSSTILGDFSLGNVNSTWSNNSPITVNGNFTVHFCRFCYFNNNVTVGGTTTIDGTCPYCGTGLLQLNAYTFTANGPFIVTSSGGFNLFLNGANLVINNSFTNNGIVNFNGGGSFVVNNLGVTFSGSGQTSIYQLTVNGSGSVINNGNISSYFLGGAGSFTQGVNSTLTIAGGNTPVTITTFDASSNINTVNYSYSGNQTVRAVNYYNLTLTNISTSTFSTITMTGVTTILNNFTVNGYIFVSAPITSVGGNISISGSPTASLTLTAAASIAGNVSIGDSTTFVAPSSILTIGGMFTRTGDGTFTHNGGTIIFNNNTLTSTITGSTSFYNLSVTTAGKTVQVNSGDTLTILNDLILTGSSGSNVVLTSTTGSSAFNITSLDSTPTISYATISWAACSNSLGIYAGDGTSTDGGNNGSCWTFASVGSVSVSGTANGNDGATVKVAVNGVVQGSTTTIGSGSWSFSNINVPANGVVVVWVDGVNDASEANAITKYDGSGNITGMVLNTNTITLGSADNPSINISEIGSYDDDSNEDLMFNGTSDTFTAYSYKTSYTSPSLTISAGTTLTVGSSGNEFLSAYSVTNQGTLISTSTGEIELTGSWTNNGTFTAGSGTVIFNSYTANTLNGTMTGTTGKFYNLEFEGTGGSWTPSGNVEAGNNLIIQDGNLIAPAILTIGGSFANNGTFTAGSGTVIFDGNAPGSWISGSLTGTNGQFNNLTFNGSGGEWTAYSDITVGGTLAMTAGTFVGSASLTINGGTVSGNGTLLFAGNETMSNIVQVAESLVHSCAINLIGDVFCWGSPTYGSLGDGQSSTSRVIPLRVLEGDASTADSRNGYLTNIKQITVFGYNSCAISYSGNTYCWGEAANGEDGDGQITTNRTTPVKVLKGAATGSDTDGTYLVNLKKIAGGDSHACAISNSGNTYCWGDSTYGKLGDNQSTVDRTTPVKVLKGAATGSDTDGTYLTNMKDISAGLVNTCALSANGNMYCWGYAGYGATGDGQTATNRTTPVKVLKGAATGSDTDATYLININRIYLAYSYAVCAISNSGYTYCWGRGDNGRLGDGQSASDRTTPVKVLKGAATGSDTDGTYLINVKTIALGQDHSCAIANYGNTYCWGSAGYGQLGNGTTSPIQTAPVKVLAGAATGSDTDGTYLINLKTISAGQNSICSYSNSGNAYCWGASGTLGTYGGSTSPLKMLTMATSFKNVSTGSSSSCGVDYSNRAYCWGSGPYIGGGDGTTVPRPNRVVKGAATGSDTDGTYLVNVKQMIVGGAVTCALTYSGNVYCWGTGSQGQLGNGTTTASQYSPVQVLKGAAVLGDNDGTYLTNISAISVGYYDACAISNSGNVYCWGYANYGALGDGQTTTNRTTPVRVVKGSSISSDNDGTYLTNGFSIATGFYHTCMIARSGYTYCWGTVTQGQVGDGQSSTLRSSPVKVLKGAAGGGESDGTYLVNMKQVAINGESTCALSHTDKVFCWGFNSYGQLGNNNTVSSTIPVQVWKGEASGPDADNTYIRNIRDLASGEENACVVARSGAAYCWGQTQGLGVNRSAGYPQPTPVRMLSGRAKPIDVSSGYVTNIASIATSNGNYLAQNRFTCITSFAGNAYCTGDSQSGQLGYGYSGSYFSGTILPENTLITVNTLASSDLPTLTVSINGSGNLGGSSEWKLPNLQLGVTVPGTVSASGSESVSIYGNFTNASGNTFNAGGKVYNFYGDFTNDGTYNGQNSTSTFNNNSNVATISGNGSTTFGGISITAPGKIVKLASGRTFVVNGYITITGTVGDPVVVTSTTGNSQWFITQNGGENISYTIISWSGCTGGDDIAAYILNGNVNGGNNGSCWKFTFTFGAHGGGNSSTDGTIGSGNSSQSGGGNQGPGSGSTNGGTGGGGNSGGGTGQGSGGGASP